MIRDNLIPSITLPIDGYLTSPRVICPVPDDSTYQVVGNPDLASAGSDAKQAKVEALHYHVPLPRIVIGIRYS